ncbi:hypothetical protein MXL22_00720 [Staphylococcus pseudoxylosus]|uniref:hypothetical protein n=1 Tax=Staphylococcus pseudoxylosus TaxID=2282419 RepID=UPI002DB95849|nr:hypothetical protein [Staphylococcus pseudoxylosus]MEB6059605.1 hypothetical protein [Staphylococcus pseudoxylosus]
MKDSRTFWDKVKSWIKAHKIWSGVIALIIISCIVGPFIEDEEQVKSDEPKKEIVNKDDKSEKKVKKEKKKKPLTTEQKVKKEVKKEVTSAKVKKINVSDYATTTAMIELEGKENLTDKMTSRSMKMGISETLHALKDSGVEFENVNISVKYPLDDGLETTKEYVIKSSWSGETISKMNDDNKNTLPDSMEQHAEDYWEHPAIK